MNVIPLRPAEAIATSRTHLAGFDLVRALAALGVVMLHACVPYARHPMPGLAWPVSDDASTLVDCVLWTIELFIMPLFLVMAGFLAWRSLSRHGGRRLVTGRARRLLVPFLFGCLVILPIELHLWVLGWVTEGLVAPVKLRSFKFDSAIDRDLWGTAHLWFLQYVFLYAVLLAAAQALYQRLSKRDDLRADGEVPAWRRRVAAGGGWLRPRLVLVTLALTAAICIWLRPQVVWGFQHASVPLLSKWIYSGVFFAAGVLLSLRDPKLDWLRGATSRTIAPAILLVIAAVTMGRWHLGQLYSDGGEGQLASITLAILTVAGATSATLAILAVAARRVSSISLPVRYLVAASFWVYLVHHPVVALVHIDLKILLPVVPPAVKAVIAFSIATGWSLMTYEAFVRRTTFGRLMGMGWSPRSEENDSMAATARRDQPVSEIGQSGRRAA